MKITKFTSRIILIFSGMVLLALLGMLAGIPFLANVPGLSLRYTAGSAGALCVFLYLADLAGIWFMVQLCVIMGSVSAGDPFREKNVRALRHMALGCMIAFLDFAAMVVAYGDFHCFGLIICTVILLFGAMCAYVLARVFAEAVRCKSENDLTV